MQPIFLHLYTTNRDLRSQIISFALVSLYGDYLYVESAQFDEEKVDEFIRIKVINSLKYKDKLDKNIHDYIYDFHTSVERNNLQGGISTLESKDAIRHLDLAHTIGAFLNNLSIRFEHKEALFIVTDRDNLAVPYLNDILDLKTHYIVTNVDLNQEIGYKLGISLKDALALNRYYLIDQAITNVPESYNALTKANLLKDCWNFIYQLNILVLGDSKFPKDIDEAIIYFEKNNNVVFHKNSEPVLVNQIKERTIDFLFIINRSKSHGLTDEFIDTETGCLMQLASAFGIPIYAEYETQDKYLHSLIHKFDISQEEALKDYQTNNKLILNSSCKERLLS